MKYVGDVHSGPTYAPGSDKCGEGAATAYDMNSIMCYPIYGLAITVGPRAASWQGLFEVCNLNWHMSDTRMAVTTLTQLPGYKKA
jgi:hypothetical protein